ncbi:MAG TPA: 3-oxoacid CoA-transferase subunit B [Limnochordales bacterium]|nr:3-oxoacid CoA-transferase subunit B [Limnochordales bacterium]
MSGAKPLEIIARRAALELQDGDVVNLGIGMPLLVADYVPDDIQVYLHTENGLLGMGPPPDSDHVDPQIVNAAKQPVTERLGASYFDSASSFAMIRGAHIDVAMLGALEVDERGMVANWTVPGRAVLGVGGAMDLLAGVGKLIILMTHRTRDGVPKLVRQCRFPLTGIRPADVVITELAVFRVDKDGLVLTELQPGVTLEQVRAATEARFRLAPELVAAGAAG